MTDRPGPEDRAPEDSAPGQEPTALREPVTLREKAYDAFTRRLLAREIRPGQFVSQRELVAVTGMPLGAIREMIPRLEVEGLLKTVPQRGMQVAHVDLTMIRDAFQLRLFLEKEAMAQFVAAAPQAEIDRLRRTHEAILGRIAAGEHPTELVAEAQAVDWDLHDTIIDFLDNRLVSEVYRVNSIKIRLIRQEQTRLLPDLLSSVMAEHMAIIDALLTRDRPGAVQALCDHIASARTRALAL